MLSPLQTVRYASLRPYYRENNSQHFQTLDSFSPIEVLHGTLNIIVNTEHNNSMEIRLRKKTFQCNLFGI